MSRADGTPVDAHHWRTSQTTDLLRLGAAGLARELGAQNGILELPGSERPALRAGAANPVALALVDALIAAIGAAYALATLLLGVVAYRVRASKGT